ncbi:MAG: response regulator [Pirellulales bacterium]|nr:response regulator [Pirellulales bacterium]
MMLRFTQSCPTCGRRIEVRASLLGCTVACQHCHAEFVAEAGDRRKRSIDDIRQIEASDDDLMARVEQLLQRAENPSAIG